MLFSDSACATSASIGNKYSQLDNAQCKRTVEQSIRRLDLAHGETLAEVAFVIIVVIVGSEVCISGHRRCDDRPRGEPEDDRKTFKDEQRDPVVEGLLGMYGDEKV